jgi:MFS family permease
LRSTSRFFKVGGYFSFAMMSAGAIMNVSKIAINDALGPSFLGILSAISVITLLSFDVLFSYIADRKSRRATASLAMLCFSFFSLSMLYITPIIMIAAAFFLGLANASFNGLAGAFLMDIFHDKTERLKWLPRLNIILLVGSLSGNIVGLFIFQENPTALWVLAASCFIGLSAITFIFLDQNTPVTNKAAGFSFSSFLSTIQWFNLTIKDKIIYVETLLIKMLFMSIQTYWIAFFSFKDARSLWILALVTSAIMITQIIANAVMNLITQYALGVLITVFSILAIVLSLILPSNPFIYTFMIAMSFTVSAIANNISYVYFQNQLGNHERGTFSSLITTISSIAGAVLLVMLAPFMKVQFMFIMMVLFVLMSVLFLSIAKMCAMSSKSSRG